MTVPAMIAILPVGDLAAATDFFARLDFALAADHGDYRILADADGRELHLTAAVPGWLEPGRNPFGLYLRVPHVEALAARFGDAIIGPVKAAARKPWGMIEFAVNGPDDVLVRVGWPDE